MTFDREAAIVDPVCTPVVRRRRQSPDPLRQNPVALPTGKGANPTIVGRGGWQRFKNVFSGGDGVIFAISR